MNLIMNSDEIFDTIESIAQTKSKNDKVAMVKACIGASEFKRVLVAAIDPLVSYGVAKIPFSSKTPDEEGEVFGSVTWQIIEDLASRKLSGSAARNVILLELKMLTFKSGELFRRIIIKDLKADFGDSTVNKAAPGTIQEFPYMRCSLPKDADLSKWDWDNGIISQEKADGMFANVNHESGGNVFILSRQGTAFPMDQFAALANSITNAIPSDTQSHGEILVTRDAEILPREIGNGIMNSVLKGGAFAENEQPIFMLWDTIPLSHIKPKGSYLTPYKERLKGMALNLLGKGGGLVRLIPTRKVYSLAEAYEHYAELLELGKEGTVIKNSTAIWRDHTSKDQIKLKLEFVVDLIVTGIVPGKANGKNAGRAGSLACETCDGKLKVNVTVKNEKMRQRVDSNSEEWIGSIIAVKANGIMRPSDSNPSHSLFLPTMVEAEYRTDKSEADSLQRVFDQEEAAKQGAAIIETLKKAA